MLPRADLSRMPALEFGGRLAVARVTSAPLCSCAASSCRITFGSMTLSPATTSTSPSKRIRSSSSAPLRRGVAGAQRLVLEGVGRARETPVDGGHDALRHAAHHHHVEHRAAQVVGLQRADDDRHPQHLEAHLVLVAGPHARSLAARQNDCDKWPFHSLPTALTLPGRLIEPPTASNACSSPPNPRGAAARCHHRARDRSAELHSASSCRKPEIRCGCRSRKAGCNSALRVKRKRFNVTSPRPQAASPNG